MTYFRRDKVRWARFTTLPPEMQRRTVGGLLSVYGASDGEATQRLYDELRAMGPIGEIALNLFRAQKTSALAKVYRPGRFGFRSEAYARKNYSLDRLTDALSLAGERAGLTWGWAQDRDREYHNWVLYVDLPTGQVSFHTSHRGSGPNYNGRWDGVTRAGPGRICGWIAGLYAPDTASQAAPGKVSVQRDARGPEPMERTDEKDRRGAFREHQPDLF